MSYAGLSRVSIDRPEKRLSTGMDGRVKPGHDGDKSRGAVPGGTHTHADRLIYALLFALEPCSGAGT
jgi:hypothetical protein